MAKHKKKNNIFSLITSLYICCLLTFFLFFCGGSGYSGIITAKFHAFCVLCGGYILIMAVVAVESLLVGTTKLHSPLTALKASSWSQRLIIIYILLTWLSALLSPFFPETVIGISRYEGALTITIYGLCFLLVSIFGRISKAMLWVLGATAVLFSLLCLVQIAGYNPFHLYPAGYGYADAYIAYPGAFLGTIGNVDFVAAFLCIVIPIIWVAMLRLTGKRRFLLLIPLALLLIVLFRMNVLAGLVGVLLGGVLTIPVVAPVNTKCKAVLWFFILILGLATAIVLFLVDFRSGFLHELHELLHGRVDDSFGSGRIQIWREVLRTVPENLLFGAGPDTMIRSGLQGFSKINEATNTIVIAEIDAAHNEYLNILFHQGIWALLSYVGALVLLLRRWIQNSSKDTITAILGAGVFGYCIQALFGLSTCITAPFFWLTLGLLESRSSANYTNRRR